LVDLAFHCFGLSRLPITGVISGRSVMYRTESSARL
jgi:hypothetical protein